MEPPQWGDLMNGSTVGPTSIGRCERGRVIAVPPTGFGRCSYRGTLNRAARDACYAVVRILIGACLAQRAWGQPPSTDPRQQAYLIEHAVDALVHNGREGEVLNLVALNHWYAAAHAARQRVSSRVLRDSLVEGSRGLADLNRAVSAIADYAAGSGRLADDGAIVESVIGRVTASTGAATGRLLDDAVALSSQVQDAVAGTARTRSLDPLAIARRADFVADRLRHEVRTAISFGGDTAYQRAFDAYYGVILGVPMSGSADAVLAANARLERHTLADAANQALGSANSAIVEAVAQGKVTPEEVVKAVNKGLRIAADASGKADTVIKLIRLLNSPDLTDQVKATLAEQLSAAEREANRTLGDAKVASDLITTFVGLFDKDAAKTLGTMASAGLDMAHLINKLSHMAPDDAVAIADVGLTDGFSIFASFLGGGGNDETAQFAALSQQIAGVSRQINALAEFDSAEFDHVNTNLATIYGAMQDGFTAIERHDAAMQQDLTDVVNRVAALQDQVLRLDADMAARFEAMRDKSDKETENRCLMFHATTPNVAADFNTLYQPCLSAFYTWSTSPVVADVNAIGTAYKSVTSAKVLADPELSATIATELTEHPTDRLELLRRVMHYTGGGPELSGSLVPSVSSWKLGADAFATLLAQYGDAYADCRQAAPPCYDPRAQLRGMIGVGEQIRLATRDLTVDVKGGGSRAAAIHALIGQYRTDLEEVSAALDTVDARYRTAADLAKASQFDLWGTATQPVPTVSRIARAWLDPGVGLDSGVVPDPSLTLEPTVVDAVTPRAWALMEMLGLGTLSYRWTPLLREAPLEIPGFPAWAPLKNRGALVLGVTLTLTPRGETARAQWGEVGSAHDFIFKQYTYSAGFAEDPGRISATLATALYDLPALASLAPPRPAVLSRDFLAAKYGPSQAYVAANWTSGENLAQRFLNERRSLYYVNPELAEFSSTLVIENANAFVETQLAAHRRAVAAWVNGSMPDASKLQVDDAIQRAERSRIVLATIVALGLSHEVSANAALSAGVYGSDGAAGARDLTFATAFAFGPAAATFAGKALDSAAARRKTADSIVAAFSLDTNSRHLGDPIHAPRLVGYPDASAALSAVRALAARRSIPDAASPRAYLAKVFGDFDARAASLDATIMTLIGGQFAGDAPTEVEQTLTRLRSAAAAWKRRAITLDRLGAADARHGDSH
jgi:hypothetical protein